MTLQIKDILEALNRLAPFDLAEDWDNVGLLIGHPEHVATSILVGLDPTTALIDEAVEKGANTIVTHHPVIFHPLPAIKTDTPSGKLLEKALINKINIIACHTNFDIAVDGVSDVLARALGLQDLQPLCPGADSQNTGSGLGRVGSLVQDTPGKEFLKTLFTVLQLSSLQIAGTLPRMVTKVAVCGGSGSDFAEDARKSGADLFLSAEIKHSTARWAEEAGFCIIDGTHYATEKPVVEHIVNKLIELAETEKWSIDIQQSETERHPFSCIIHTNNL